jgi:hypothetical protein
MIVKLILDSITEQNNDLCMHQVSHVVTHGYIYIYREEVMEALGFR